MTRRLLDRCDYGRLVGTALEPLIDTLPADTDVIVVEDADGRIVGSAAIFTREHVECPFVAEDHRNHPGVFWLLLQGIRLTARRRGATRIVAGSIADAEGEDRIGAFLAKMHAEPMPGTLWAWPIGKES